MKLTKEEIQMIIKDHTVIGSLKPKEKLGGQSCGMPSYPIRLTCETFDFELTVNYHRSSLRNKEDAILLFELYLSNL